MKKIIILLNLSIALLAVVHLSNISFHLQAATVNSKTDIDKGTVLYERYCLTCHGDAGEGDGPAVLVLPQEKIVDLKNSILLKDNSSTAFIEYLKLNAPIKSVSKLKHYSTNISGQDLNKLIYYFTSLKKLRPNQAPRYINYTYSTSCIFCHGYLADGKGVVNNFVGKKPTTFRGGRALRYNRRIWLRILQRSQHKIIRMGGSNPHFFKALSIMETEQLYKALRKITGQK